MTSLLSHFNEKNILPFGRDFFVWRQSCTINSNEIQCSSGVESGTQKEYSEQLTKKGFTVERTNLKKEVIKSTSATETVKDCIILNKQFDVNSFGTNPIIASLVREVTGKNGNQELTPEELKKVIELYPQKAMEVHLRETGQWEKFLNTCSDYKEVLKKYWDSETIANDFQKNGKNAMTIAGASYGLSVLFGLGGKDSSWYKELTNANAYKQSGKKLWKAALAGLIGGEVAGLKLFETAGLATRAYFNGLGQASYLAVALFDKLFSPSQWVEIVAGKEITRQPSKEDLERFLPVLKGYLKPEYQIIFGQYFEKQTGKQLELTKSQIDQVAHLTVLLADSEINDNFEDTLKPKPWKKVLLQNLTNQTALSLARHPDEKVRKQFEEAMNLEIEKQKSYRKDPNSVPDWKPLFKVVDGKNVGEITKIIDNEKFDKDFNNGAKQLLSKMTASQRKSILEMATSHGLTGLLIMAWVFLQGTFWLTSGVFSVGGEIFGKEKNNNKEKNNPKVKSIDSANKILALESKNLKKDDWQKLLKELLVIGAINKTVFKKLKKHKKYQDIFEQLKKSGFTITNSSKIEDLAQMQKSFKSALDNAKIKTDFIPLGSFDKALTGSKRKKALKQLDKFHEDLVKFKSKIKENYDFERNGILGTFKKVVKDNPKLFMEKRALEIKNRLKNLFGKTRTAKTLFEKLGIPASRLDELTSTKKGDGVRLDSIILLSDEVLKFYKKMNP